MRAVVADDHPVFRTGLRTLLEDLGVDVVAEAGDGEEAVEAVRRERPDVVLMDLQMPRLGGIEATRRLLAEDPDAKVLVLTMVADDEAVFAALQAGALGYLLKGAGQDEIGRALTAVAAGQAVYGADVARRVRAFFTAGRAWSRDRSRSCPTASARSSTSWRRAARTPPWRRACTCRTRPSGTT